MGECFHIDSSCTVHLSSSCTVTCKVHRCARFSSAGTRGVRLVHLTLPLPVPAVPFRAKHYRLFQELCNFLHSNAAMAHFFAQKVRAAALFSHINVQNQPLTLCVAPYRRKNGRRPPQFPFRIGYIIHQSVIIVKMWTRCKLHSEATTILEPTKS